VTRQTDIFPQLGYGGDYTELCNALFEAELVYLARSQEPRFQTHGAALQRRLASVPQYVRKTAAALLEAQLEPAIPLALDVQSACWLAKQRSKPWLPSDASHKLAAWLGKHAKLALPLPVFVLEESTQTISIRLDSVDQLALEQEKLHLNYYGWFGLDGEHLDAAADGVTLHLLQPKKAVLAAACAGHRWRAGHKLPPQALDLRSLLLSASIDWQHLGEIRRCAL